LLKVQSGEQGEEEPKAEYTVFMADFLLAGAGVVVFLLEFLYK